MSYGKFSGPRDQVVLAGTRTPVVEEARNFGRTRTGAKVVSGSGAAASPRTLGGRSGERLFANNGELNASNKREFLDKIGDLLEGYQGGQRTGRARMFERQNTEEYDAVKQTRLQALREAEADSTGAGYMILGEIIGDEVYETLGREGFTRQCFMVRNLEDKEIARVKVRKKDVSAVISTTNINTTKVMVRQHYVYPKEFYIKGFVSIEEKEIAQTGAELLDDKYQDLLEQIMVQEDLHSKRRWDDAVGIFNPQMIFSTFTPLFFSQGCVSIDHWGIPCTRAVMAWDLWNDIRAEPEFSNWFDPVTKHALILEGKLGSLMDVQLITDGFRYDTLRVLDDGEIYFLGPQIALGTVSQRKPLEAKPTDGYNRGLVERGWLAFQIQALTSFPRASAKSVRVAA